MSKIISLQDAVAKINDADTVLVGGFYAVGTPENIIGEIIRQGKGNLTAVSNDTGTPTEGLGRLIYAGLVKKLITSFASLTPIIPELIEKGELVVEFNPQGTLVERIRAGGYGLEGVLTRTGLGTLVEKNGCGTRMRLNGRDMLYHTPLRGNITILEAYEADEQGNLIFRRTQRNFSDTMCFASDIVIASIVKPIKKIGEIDPDHIMVPGTLVDYLVQREA
jgi:acetate CoA/acetoacetate CoA-transferase alpha subunit